MLGKWAWWDEMHCFSTTSAENYRDSSLKQIHSVRHNLTWFCIHLLDGQIRFWSWSKQKNTHSATLSCLLICKLLSCAPNWNERTFNEIAGGPGSEITRLQELTCNTMQEPNCIWHNTDDSTVKWRRGTGRPSQSRLRSYTGSSVPPVGHPRIFLHNRHALVGLFFLSNFLNGFFRHSE